MLTKIGRLLWQRSAPGPAPELCAFPPPYKRMIAINSDVEFTGWATQIGLLRAFAARGLETGFSYWFFGDPANTWTLFNDELSETAFAAAAFHLIREGLLDTIHSFGGIANGRGARFNRADIASGYRRLEEQGIRQRVYSNHGTIYDTQNIGGEWATALGEQGYQKGDVVGDRRYHLDLTAEHGVRFYWTDQDIRPEKSFSVSPEQIPASLFLAQTSRDGRRILRFRRTMADVAPDGCNLHEALRNLLAAELGGYAVLYTHLGVKRDSQGKPLQIFMGEISNTFFDGLEVAADDQRRGRTLFTTTERLLTHALMMAARPWSIHVERSHVHITLKRNFEYQNIPFTFDWSDFRGLAIRLASRKRVTLHLDKEARAADQFSVDGVHYAGIKWQPIDMFRSIERAQSLAPV
jgi:hypothetical protein